MNNIVIKRQSHYTTINNKVRKMRHLLSFAFLLLTTSIHIQAQTDITEKIAEADFSSTDGWTQYCSTDYSAIGNGEIGTYDMGTGFNPALTNTASTTDGTHLSTEYCFGFECRWQGNYSSYIQTVSLPAGNYELTYDVENRNGNTSNQAYDNLFYVEIDGTRTTDSNTEWMQSATSWNSHSISFSLLQAAEVKISLGYGTGSNNTPHLNTPVLYVSHLKLYDHTFESPVATNYVVNGYFNDNVDGWSRTGGFQNSQTDTKQTGAFTGNFWENWDPGAKVNKMYQTITGLPSGTYKLSIAAFVNTLASPNTSQYVFADANRAYLTTGDPTMYEIYTYVDDGTLEIGLNQTTATANWMGIDNVSLSYCGSENYVLEDALKRFRWHFEDYITSGTEYGRVSLSQEAWDELKPKADAAIAAQNNGNTFAQYAQIAYELNDQLDKAEASLTLWQRYRALVEGNASVGLDVSAYTTNDVTASDAAITAIFTDISREFHVYADGHPAESIDMDAFLGVNLDGSGSVGAAYDSYFPNMLRTEGWDLKVDGLIHNADWLQTGKKTDDATHNPSLLLRKGWYGYPVTMQLIKERMLPAGHYFLTYKIATQSTNITNDLCYFTLDGVQTWLTSPGTGWQDEESVEFTIEEGDYKTFDLSFGFESNDANVGGGDAPQVLVTDIHLELIPTSMYKFALDKARELLSADQTGVIQAAIDQWGGYEGHEEDFESPEQRVHAILVLNNARAFAQTSGEATSAIANADFSQRTAITEGGNANKGYPTGWTFVDTHSGTEDVWTNTETGIFNAWAPTITEFTLQQLINYLPQGQYKLVAQVATDTHDGTSQIALFAAPDGGDVGRSTEVVAGPTDFDFEEVEVQFVVGESNQATIGIRSDLHYYQVKNFQLFYVAEDPAAVVDGQLYQMYHWTYSNEAELTLSETSDEFQTLLSQSSEELVLYPSNKNQIIYATAEEAAHIAATAPDGVLANVVVDDGSGNLTCENLVVTDLVPLVITKGPFLVNTATYTRNMTYVYGTVLLPYPFSQTSRVHYYNHVNYTTATDLVNERDELNFTHIEEEIPANTPVLLRKMDGVAGIITISNTNVTVENTTDAIIDTELSGWTHQGYYSEQNFNIDAEPNLYYIAHDHFWQIQDNVKVPPFRTVFRSSGGGANVLGISVDDELADAIRRIEMEENAAAGKGGIYTISGQRVSDKADVSGLAPGLYIVNGKKVLVK